MEQIHKLFHKAVAEDPRIILDRESDWGVSNFFRSTLDNKSIPVLSSKTCRGTVPSGTIVRVVGMIQDIQDPEIYGRIYEAHNEATNDVKYVQTQYRENPTFKGLRVNFQNPKSLAERVPLVICPIPGHNSWVFPLNEGNDDDKSEKIPSSSSCLMTTPRGDAGKKRRRDDAMLEEQAPKRRTAGDLNISPPSKDSSQSVAPPIPGSVLVKVHLDKDRVAFKLNEVVEFVGIFCVDPVGASTEFEKDEDQFHTTPLHLPCVHSIVFRRRRSLIHFPTRELKCLSSARSDLKTLLMHRFGGDELVTEYMILYLVSCVREWREPCVV